MKLTKKPTFRALNTYTKLMRAAESVTARTSRQMTAADLTVSQFGVLETLFHLGPLSQSEICSKLLKSGGNITLVIDNLEKRGLVRRQTDAEDRRVTIVSLTGSGEELIQKVFPNQVKAIEEELSALTDEEQQVFGMLCKKLGLQKA